MLNTLALTSTQPLVYPGTNGDPQLSAASSIGATVFLIIILALCLITLIGLWKVFTKAGIPGILAIIPIVNLFFFPKVGGKPGWWGLLLLIPFVNIIIGIIIFIGIAECFGRGVGTVLGLIFLKPIFICILGFGSAKWTAPPAVA